VRGSIGQMSLLLTPYPSPFTPHPPVQATALDLLKCSEGKVLPARVNGPVAIVAQDILSLAVYLGIAILNLRTHKDG
jgi:hypothetical protein